MTAARPLTGVELGDWLITELMSSTGEVTMRPAVLDEARARLAGAKDLVALRDCAESVVALAQHLGGERGDVKAGEALLQLVIELAPRFERELAEASFEQTDRSVQVARAARALLGGEAGAPPPASPGDTSLPASRLHRPVKG